MVLGLYNLAHIALLAFLNLVHFNDAEAAMNAGIFTATSTTGYSITKSIFLYAGLLGLSFALSLLFSKIFKKYFSDEAPRLRDERPFLFPTLARQEYIFLGVFLFLVAAGGILFREKILT